MKKQQILITILMCSFTINVLAQDGWEMLFNGKDFSNFEQLNGQATYKIENGEMIGISKLKTPNTCVPKCSFLCRICNIRSY